ncbi:MAG: hypothetical protein WA860_03250 [Acidimicrobiales bacterium]
MKRTIVVPLLVIATLLLTSSMSSAMGLKSAGKQYLTDVAPANAALKSFESEIHAWTNSTPDAEGEHQAAPVFTALRTLQRNLLSQTWPRFVKGGVRFICDEDITSLEEDLSMIDSNSSLGNGAFQFTFSADSKTIDSHALYVRRDLGLPGGRAL